MPARPHSACASRGRRRAHHGAGRFSGRAAPIAALVLLCALVAACSSANSSSPTWRPQPSFTGDGGQNATNDIPGGPSSTPGGPSPSGSSGSPRPSGGQDPNVVATKLTTPTAIAVLPNMTALVGERTTGRIRLVQAVAGRPTPVVKTIPGLSTAGGGGLLDLMLSPYYDSDGLIYAYVTTPADNRVVEFTLKGSITPVLTGIPRGGVHNTGRLATDGRYVYIATGDAGVAAGPTTLNGKVLRVTDIGRPAPDNPVTSSPVFAGGASVTVGLCYATNQGLLFATGAAGNINLVNPAGQLSATSGVTTSLPANLTAPGGCAVQGGALYVTSADATALVSATFKVNSEGAPVFGKWQSVLSRTYGRLLTVVAAADGSLWMTTTNRDGHGKPVAADERVIRIVAPQGGGGDSPV